MSNDLHALHLYTYRISWSPEDQEYIGTCAEFSSLSWLAKSAEGALRGIRKLLADVLQDMRKTGEQIPTPLSTKQYSGRFRVRIPPELHRGLSIHAAEQGVSLNRLVSSRLATV